MNASSDLSRVSPSRMPGLVCMVLATALCVSLDPSHARGGDIVYTWHDDDNGSTFGYLEVKSTVQAAGNITFDDIINFGFHSPDTNYGFPFMGLSPNPVPISTLTAGFTGSNSYIVSYNAQATITLPITSNYDVIGGEHWSETGYGGSYSGVGHWVITGAVSAVPEPSALVLAIISMSLSGLGYAWCQGSRRRPNRPIPCP